MTICLRLKVLAFSCALNHLKVEQRRGPNSLFTFVRGFPLNTRQYSSKLKRKHPQPSKILLIFYHKLLNSSKLSLFNKRPFPMVSAIFCPSQAQRPSSSPRRDPTSVPPVGSWPETPHASVPNCFFLFLVRRRKKKKKGKAPALVQSKTRHFGLGL